MPKKSSDHTRNTLTQHLERAKKYWRGPNASPQPSALIEPPAGTDHPSPQTPSRPRIKNLENRARWQRKTLYGRLELSTIMSALHHPAYPRHSHVREVVDHLVEGNRQQAVESFNRHFGDETVTLRLHCSSLEEEFLVTEDVPPTRISTALRKLLLSPEPHRIKICAGCSTMESPTYFLDLTRPRNQKYCTPACTSRTTSRTYRQQHT
jgi:predicted RNA-binding Zn ribbon-like protein